MADEKRKSAADKWVKRGFLIVLLAAATAVVYIQYRGPAQDSSWGHDLEAALVQAKAENRPVLVFVRSFPLGGNDQQMIEVTLRNNFKRLQDEKYILVDLRLDASAGWARRYGVTASPTTLRIAPDGLRFHKAEGLIGQVDFSQEFLKAPLKPVSTRPAG